MIYCWTFKFGAGAFRTGRVLEWRRPIGDEDFRVVKALEWRNGRMLLQVGNVSGMEGSSGKAG